MLITTPAYIAEPMAAYVEQHAVELLTLVAPTVVNVPVHEVPFYSQFRDITSSKWQKVGCGITSLAMIIDYYTPNAVTVNGLLDEGLKAHAYQNNAGWIHSGLIKLSNSYGLEGTAYYLTNVGTTAALKQLEGALAVGPVIASVHYKMEPTNPIPHMVVVLRIEDGQVYYNDPAEKSGDAHISVSEFQKAWKQKYIALRPNRAHGGTASAPLTTV